MLEQMYDDSFKKVSVKKLLRGEAADADSVLEARVLDAQRIAGSNNVELLLADKPHKTDREPIKAQLHSRFRQAHLDGMLVKGCVVRMCAVKLLPTMPMVRLKDARRVILPNELATVIVPPQILVARHQQLGGTRLEQLSELSRSPSGEFAVLVEITKIHKQRVAQAGHGRGRKVEIVDAIYNAPQKVSLEAAAAAAPSANSTTAAAAAASTAERFSSSFMLFDNQVYFANLLKKGDRMLIQNPYLEARGTLGDFDLTYGSATVVLLSDSSGPSPFVVSQTDQVVAVLTRPALHRAFAAPLADGSKYDYARYQERLYIKDLHRCMINVTLYGRIERMKPNVCRKEGLWI